MAGKRVANIRNKYLVVLLSSSTQTHTHLVTHTHRLTDNRLLGSRVWLKGLPELMSTFCN